MATTATIFLDESSSEDSEVEFMGFERKAMTTAKKKELEDDGIAYMGYNLYPKPKPTAKVNPPSRSVSTTASTVGREEPIEISSDDDEEEEEEVVVRPSKFRRVSKSRSVPTHTSAPESRTGVRRRTPANLEPVASSSAVARCEDGNPEDWVISALDLDHRPNWEPVNKSQGVRLSVNDDSDEEEDLSGFAGLSIQDDADTHLLGRTLALSCRTTAPGRLRNRSSERQLFYAKLEQALSRPGPSQRTSESKKPRHGYFVGSCHSTVCKLDRLQTVHEAPGDVNTVVQSGNLVICASAVSDGSFNDVPGPYNRGGSLGLWDGGRAHILKGHCAPAVRDPVLPQEHYFTVNDVAIDPTSSTRFASAGRDRKVMIWEYDTAEDKPKATHCIICDDNPEVIKYRPGSYTLAVQCDNGIVYIMRGGRLRHKLQVAPPHKNHVTADIQWGVGPSDGYLFASSAGASTPAGYHKAFDVNQQKVVMEFDADDEACSTSALDSLGATLYITTEGPECQYILRAFDVRRRADARTAVHQITLEPFKGNPNYNDIDINCLSISSDGLYIAAARTDNYVDVYDARKLSRGPLYKFAHEDREDGRDGIDTYGVVKVQWVDGLSYGTGFVSGGVDGCVRLWDVKRASEDPYNGRVLARCVDDVATFSLGNLAYDEAPIVVGERSGKVSIFGFTRK